MGVENRNGRVSSPAHDFGQRLMKRAQFRLEYPAGRNDTREQLCRRELPHGKPNRERCFRAFRSQRVGQARLT
jgi:hypothetical protein